MSAEGVPEAIQRVTVRLEEEDRRDSLVGAEGGGHVLGLAGLLYW